MSESLSNTLWQPATKHKRRSGTWWEGRRVRLDREIRTRGGDVYRKGRIVKVARKYGGLTLRGRQLYVTGVDYHKLSVDTNRTLRAAIDAAREQPLTGGVRKPEIL